MFGISFDWLHVAYGVGVVLVLLLMYSSFVYVPNNRVGVLERLWSGKGSVRQGIIALNGEAGYVPELLRGGFHVLFPFQYRVHKVDLVVVPQGIRRVLPALVNQFIALLKGSALVYFLGLVAQEREPFQVGRDLNAQTGNLSPLVAAGLFYLLLTIPLTHLVNYIDNRLRRF